MRGLLEDGTEIGTYGISEGVAGSDGGGGRLMKVGADMVMECSVVVSCAVALCFALFDARWTDNMRLLGVLKETNLSKMLIVKVAVSVFEGEEREQAAWTWVSRRKAGNNNNDVRRCITRGLCLCTGARVYAWSHELHNSVRRRAFFACAQSRSFLQHTISCSKPDHSGVSQPSYSKPIHWPCGAGAPPPPPPLTFLDAACTTGVCGFGFRLPPCVSPCGLTCRCGVPTC